MGVLRVYARAVHGLRVEGREHIPGSRCADGSSRREGEVGPLIVVCNHTAGIDPVLVQCACPFEVRWMMGADMMHPLLKDLWAWVGIIGVDRASQRGDAGALREGLRHLEEGGVLGIFPQGRIEHAGAQGEDRKRFAAGVGLLVRKSGAPVLAVRISGTPSCATAWGSLWRPSRSVVEVLGVRDYGEVERAGMKPAEIAADLEAWVRGERAEA
ncbi:MAG TPA: lysophospholipid acyltransferase family protein, partial [Phycisphaerales bacterium]|nr:lysophospholipid acyltransferase family protein [Phycisphaerales bacterium]